ncbi:hypothetical protein ACIPEL_15230 [Streptomyces griseoviridis]
MAEAATAVLAARLVTEIPGLGREETHRVAARLAADLAAAGFRVTVPVTALRRLPGGPRTTT